MTKGGLKSGRTYSVRVLGTPQTCSPAISVSARQILSCGPSVNCLQLPSALHAGGPESLVSRR
jgi:hypothetical protein